MNSARDRKQRSRPHTTFAARTLVSRRARRSRPRTPFAPRTPVRAAARRLGEKRVGLLACTAFREERVCLLAPRALGEKLVCLLACSVFRVCKMLARKRSPQYFLGYLI